MAPVGSALREHTFLCILYAALLFFPVLSQPAVAQKRLHPDEEKAALLGRLSNLTGWLGMLVGEKEGSVVVGYKVKEIEGVDLKSGDEIISLNDQKIDSVTDLKKLYRSIDSTGTVSVSVRRKMKATITDTTITFKKPGKTQIKVDKLQSGGGS